jgi:hypothetical protein
MVNLLVESGGKEFVVSGLSTLRTKQGAGGRPVVGEGSFAEDCIAGGTFTGIFYGDGAGVVFIVVHFGWGLR